ncbi:MAG: putative Ig domain-containing protein, partial [Burkholderiales bacterium]
QSATEDSAFSYTLPGGAFGDVDTGDTLTLSATLASGDALPSWLSFNAGTGVFSGTPANGDVGANTVRVTATDGSHASVSGDFTLTVGNTNDAPTTVGIANQSVTEDSALSFTVPSDAFNDADATDTLTLSAALASGDALPSWLSFNAGTRTFSGNPVMGDAGALTVRVTATDGSNASVSSDFTLTVIANQRAPVVTTPADIVVVDTAAQDVTVPSEGQLQVTDTVGTTLHFALSNGTSVPATLIDGQSYDLQQAGSHGTLWLDSATGRYVFVPTAAAVNAAAGAVQESFEVTVSDGGLATSTVLTVQIDGTDDAPQGSVALTGTAQVGQVLSASAALSDAEGVSSVALRWQVQDTAGGWSDVAGATGATLLLDGALAGHSVRVVARVTDDAGAQADVASAGTAAIAPLPVVNTQAPPLLPPPPVQQITLISDSGAGAAGSSAVISPSVGGFVRNNPTLGPSGGAEIHLPSSGSGGGVVDVPGPAPLGGLSVERGSAPLTTLASAPLVALPELGTASVAAGGSLQFALPSDTFRSTDPDAALSLQVRLANGQPLPGWLKFDPVTGTLSGQAPAGFKGVLQIQITARDSRGHSASTHLEVDVLGPQALPETQPDASPDAPPQPTSELGLPVKPLPVKHLAARPGLSEQLRSAGARPGVVERLAAVPRPAPPLNVRG